MANPLATLENMPSEIVQQILRLIPTLDGHVSLSQTNKKFRQLYENKGDDFWKVLCMESGYGKSSIYVKQNWKENAAAVVYHSHTCVVCKSCLVKVGMKDLSNILAQTSPKIQVLDSKTFKNMSKKVADAETTPHIAQYFQHETGVQFDFDWDCKDILDRPHLDIYMFEECFPGKAGIDLYNDPNRRLRKHIFVANLLSTTVPINSIQCITEGQVPFEHPRLAGVDWSNVPESFMEEACLSRKSVNNSEGLTIMDVMGGASAAPSQPETGGETPLDFHGVSLKLGSGEMWFNFGR